MKNKFTHILLAIVFAGIIQVQAQTKIGYFDLQYALPQLPEYKQAEAELKTYGDQLSKEMETKKKELETKYDAYVKAAETMLPEIRESKEKELQALQQGMQEFQQNAQKKIQEKEAKLLAPIYEKLEKAIDEVAKTNAFTFILRKESILFELPDNNISDLVLKKLGVTPTATIKPK